MQHDLWALATGVHKPGSTVLASSHEGIGVIVIKTKLVHPPENAFAVSAVARGHTLAYTMQKQRKDLIFIFVKKNHPSG